MNKFTQIILIVVALILLIIAILKFGGCPNCDIVGTDTATSTDLIRVTTPEPDALVQSPLVVRGEARGNWYFEASFPVYLYDANGQELRAWYAEAQGEWMTTDFVPFETVINFSSPTTETGTLVLKKDNASGLPEHDAEISIPVRFAPSSSDTRKVLLYYYNESKDKDSEGNIMCSSQGLSIVERNLPHNITPVQDAIRELLKGSLTSVERSQGITTEFPLAGLTLESAALTNGVLTLNFSDPENKTSGGSCRVNILRAQIEATAKQFDAVTEVRLAPAELFQP